MKSSIKKINSEFTVVEKNENNIFSFSDKDGSKISVYNTAMVEKIIDDKFNKKYRKLLYLVMETIENEDADETDLESLILKIDGLRRLLLNKYYKYIGKDMMDKYLKMILLLEAKIKMPIRGRGR